MLLHVLLVMPWLWCDEEAGSSVPLGVLGSPQLGVQGELNRVGTEIGCCRAAAESPVASAADAFSSHPQKSLLAPFSEESELLTALLSCLFL